MDIVGTGAIGAIGAVSLRLQHRRRVPRSSGPDETRLIPRMMAVQRGTAPELADLAPLSLCQPDHALAIMRV
ncbi:hypothetical protein [Pseudonocardia sp. MH-G8]|uniref:hypothetical protein n=1 Tax=Pseudonocardia sp. MH-G8 TaxID=1854588 RepID=UPI00117AAEEE